MIASEPKTGGTVTVCHPSHAIKGCPEEPHDPLRQALLVIENNMTVRCGPLGLALLFYEVENCSPLSLITKYFAQL